MKYSSLGAVVVVVVGAVVEGGGAVVLVVGAGVGEEVLRGVAVVVGAGSVVLVTVVPAVVVGPAVTEGAATASRAAAVTTLELSGDGRLVTSSRTLDTADVASTIEASVAPAQAMNDPILLRTTQWWTATTRRELSVG